MGQGKDEMEVGHGEHFGFSGLQPSLPGYLLTFGAMPIPAGMIHDTLSPAVVAAIEVASQIERCGS